MTAIIIRRQEEAGFRQLDNDVIAYRAIGYSRHLLNLGVSPDEFERVYEIALSIYNDTPNVGPFGVDHLMQAAKKLKRKAAAKEVVFKKPEQKVMVSCSTCQGSKMAFHYINGKAVGIIRDADGAVKKCEDCAGL